MGFLTPIALRLRAFVSSRDSRACPIDPRTGTRARDGYSLLRSARLADPDGGEFVSARAGHDGQAAEGQGEAGQRYEVAAGARPGEQGSMCSPAPG